MAKQWESICKRNINHSSKMDNSFLFSLGIDTIDNINGMLVDYRETTGYDGHVKFYNLNLKITSSWQKDKWIDTEIHHKKLIFYTII